MQHFCRALATTHPLASLPLEALPLETGLVLDTARQLDTLGNWFRFEHLQSNASFELEGDWQTTVRELAVDSGLLAAVAADPALCPNSTFEARVFQLDAQPPTLLALSLRSLSLACLSEQTVRVRPSDAREVMGLLLTLGTVGGAYGEARSAAYGRLLAWRSLTALVGLPAGTPLPEVEALAQRTHWLRFESDSRWFHHVSLDVGLVALRADCSLAVLAVTDTD